MKARNKASTTLKRLLQFQKIVNVGGETKRNKMKLKNEMLQNTFEKIRYLCAKTTNYFRSYEFSRIY